MLIAPHTFLFLGTKTYSSSVFRNNSCQDQGLDTFKAYYNKNPIVLHCFEAIWNVNDKICQRLQIEPKSPAFGKQLFPNVSYDVVFRSDVQISCIGLICGLKGTICLSNRQATWTRLAHRLFAKQTHLRFYTFDFQFYLLHL